MQKAMDNFITAIADKLINQDSSVVNNTSRQNCFINNDEILSELYKTLKSEVSSERL